MRLIVQPSTYIKNTNISPDLSNICGIYAVFINREIGFDSTIHCSATIRWSSTAKVHSCLLICGESIFAAWALGLIHRAVRMGRRCVKTNFFMITMFVTPINAEVPTVLNLIYL